MEENGGERICDTSKDGGLVSWARLLVGRPLVPLGRWVVGPPDHRRPFFFSYGGASEEVRKACLVDEFS